MSEWHRLAALSRGRRIGLLGGSFNPAHDGHLHISRQAIRALALDAVWWMVSPQNPLKGHEDMAAFDARLAEARGRAAGERRIRVTGVERELGTRYTADTLEALRRRFPCTRFVWLMGADNLIQLPRWERWAAIMESVPVAVIDRPTYSLRALAGMAARRFERQRVRQEDAASLADREAPAWVFLRGPLHPASATEIRAARRRGDSRARETKQERRQS